MRFRSKTILACSMCLVILLSRFDSQINPYFLNIIVDIGVAIVLAVSLNLINGYTGQFSLGHAGLMAVGAYASGAITTLGCKSVFLAQSGFGSVLPQAVFLGALIVGGLSAAAIGFLMSAPSLRLKGDYLAMVTLGVGEIIRVGIQNMPSVGSARGLSGIPAMTTLFWTYATVLITIYAITAMVHSTYGRGFLAVRDDEIAAEAMGIDTIRYKVTAFVIGSFFAGIAGGLYAHFKQFISPDGFGFMKSVEIVVMVILGGMGNTIGVILAAIVLTLLPELLRSFNEYRMIFYSLLLIIMMLLCPQGLFSPLGNIFKRMNRSVGKDSIT